MNFALIVQNYEALTPQQKSLAPNGAGTYQLAKRCLAARQATPTDSTIPKK